MISRKSVFRIMLDRNYVSCVKTKHIEHLYNKGYASLYQYSNEYGIPFNVNTQTNISIV